MDVSGAPIRPRCRASFGAWLREGRFARVASANSLRRGSSGTRRSPGPAHRRISLRHRQRMSWARVVGDYVGSRDIRTMADTYTHVLADETELDYERLLT